MQRVQLARALAQAVGLLILDEPFEGLETAARQRGAGSPAWPVGAIAQAAEA